MNTSVRPVVAGLLGRSTAADRFGAVDELGDVERRSVAAAHCGDVGLVARCVGERPPRGRELVPQAETTRLVGSTSAPVWYAEQLAAIPASYRIP